MPAKAERVLVAGTIRTEDPKSSTWFVFMYLYFYAICTAVSMPVSLVGLVYLEKEFELYLLEVAAMSRSKELVD